MTWEGLSPPYGTIVADPPWEFRNAGGGSYYPGRPVRMDYGTMSLEDIAALPVGDLAGKSGWLALWSTRNLFREGSACEIARAWGFEPYTEFIWEKVGLGAGCWPRPCHEPVLIAKRGKPEIPADRSLRSVHQWPTAAVHSAKPPAFGDLVEAHLPGPYVELFARAPRLGWDSWGKGYELGEVNAS